jgi:uracil-DNA glycosylase
MSLIQSIPQDWQCLLPDLVEQSWWQVLEAFVEQEYRSETIYPPRSELFKALEYTPPSLVRVVILGQDPYPGAGQAHGLSFSVLENTPIPKSLQNIYKEMATDLGVSAPKQGCLRRWAEQGVLLLNTVLTVRAGQSNSHRKQGWEQFTDLLLYNLAERSQPCAFVLWGLPARKKKELLMRPQHLILESPHPSPLSAYQGFWGTRPFSRINDWLKAQNLSEIDWQIN